MLEIESWHMTWGGSKCNTSHYVTYLWKLLSKILLTLTFCLPNKTIGLVRLKIEIGWLFHFPAQSAKNFSSKKIHYYWSASSFFITMKLSPLLSQKRTVLLLLLFLFAIERLSLPPERGHNFIVIPGRFSHNTKSADAIFCLSTSMDQFVEFVFKYEADIRSCRVTRCFHMKMFKFLKN